jgi:ankyrin repeat protein
MNSNWIHRMDVEGKTPLDRAFETGHRTIAEMLLRREEEQSTEGEEDQAPLHRAAALGLDTAVKSLITCGLSPDATDTNGQTALHLAVRAGHTQVVYEGMTPLHWASIVGNTEIAELLIAQGGDPSVPNDLMDGVNTTQLAGLMQYDELSTALDSRESFV